VVDLFVGHGAPSVFAACRGLPGVVPRRVVGRYAPGMKQWLRRNWKPVTLVAAGVLAIFGLPALLAPLGVDAGAVSATAGAVSAVAAMVAAVQSSSTARDASRALALSTKPQLIVEPQIVWVDEPHTEQVRVLVRNTSPHRVESAELRWRLRDGSKGSRVLGPLDAAPHVPNLLFGNPSSSYDPVLIPSPGRISGTDEFSLTYTGRFPGTGWRLLMPMIVRYGDTSEDAGVPWRTGAGQPEDRELT